MLPQPFLERMRNLLKDEFPQFLQSYDENSIRSLRVNPLKGGAEAFLQKAPFSLTPVDWEKNGFYYGPDDRPGRHPWHEAGVYYIQEASAMAPVGYLDLKPGQRVLDLCAAPGGKSAQIAAAMEGSGLLISNEIHPGRAKILSENMERMGVTCALVTNEGPKELSDAFPEYFDRILVDAPCSGEGMFRKNEEARREWSEDNVLLCAGRQDEILEYAAGMLCPGGRLVYSTCTFAPQEDEGAVGRFLKRHPEFYAAEAVLYPGMARGVPEWTPDAACGLEKTIRLWPHLVKGEGHFLAVLQKEGYIPADCRTAGAYGLEKGAKEKDCADCLDFLKENTGLSGEGVLIRFGEQVYLAPEGMPSLRGLRALRPGLHLGTSKKNRFEPSHALALALSEEKVNSVLRLSAEDDRVLRYLNGQTLPLPDGFLKGWCLVTVDGYSLGWGKAAGGILKNHYPKGLRKNL